MINWKKIFGFWRSQDDGSNKKSNLRNTPLRYLLEDNFSFLKEDFGFIFSDDGSLDDRKIVSYKNEFTVIELASSYTWFHALARKIIRGVPGDYNDKELCINFEELAILDSLENYDHFDYYVSSVDSLEKVMDNTASLFKRNIKCFTTDKWIDYAQLQKLKKEEFYKAHGFYPKEKIPLFIDFIDKKLTPILKKSDYTKVRKSNQLPPYDSRKLFKHILYKNDNHSILIKQVDWRDDPYNYRLKVDDKVILEFSISNKEEEREKIISGILQKIHSKISG